MSTLSRCSCELNNISRVLQQNLEMFFKLEGGKNMPETPGLCAGSLMG